MLDPNNVSEIVTETLKRMDVREPSIANLIKGTFAAESGLETMYDRNMLTMAYLRPAEVKTMFGETLKFNRKLKDRIKIATDIDMDKISIESFMFHLKSNIAFMTAFLYVYYSNAFDEAPDNNIDNIAKVYVKYFVKEDDLEAELHFKKTFADLFR